MSYGVKSVRVAATADGANNSVIAAVSGKRIVIVGGTLTAWHATAGALVDLRDGASGSVVASFQSGLVNAPSVVPIIGSVEAPAFELSMNTALVIDNAAGVDTTGYLTYMLK